MDFCRSQGLTRVGVLATKGTVSSGAYKTVFESAGIEYVTCTPEEQEIISDVIYNKIKKGITPEPSEFMSVANALKARGCEAIVLGCTELSILKRTLGLPPEFIDSLEVLALCSIRLCGKEPVGFDEALMKFYPERNDI